MNPKSLYICSFCGKSTIDVDDDYLVGYNHLECQLRHENKPFKIVNWEKLNGKTLVVMGTNILIKEAKVVDETQTYLNYSAYAIVNDSKQEILMRIDLYTSDMELALKVFPPLKLNMTPFHVYKNISKDHLKDSSIFLSTIGEMMIADAGVKNIFSYVW